jgi:hypothetical protein
MPIYSEITHSESRRALVIQDIKMVLAKTGVIK